MKILFVGMPHSVHSVRWVELVSNRGWDLHFYPSMLARVDPDMPPLTVHRPLGIPGLAAKRSRIRHLVRYGAGISPRLAPVVRGALPFIDPRDLARMIRRIAPDIIHTLETQAAGYMALEARRLSDSFPTWVHSNWGSDIYLYGKLSEHASRIREVLEACDAYHSECERDVLLAQQFGFRGQVFPVAPICGGFDLEALAQLRKAGPSSRRTLIVLKGITSWAGRALFALRALELCADKLRNFPIAITSATEDVAVSAQLIAHRTGLQIDLIPRVRPSQVHAMLGRARFAIGVNVSDAASTTMLEALAMGALPIQSHMSCADEWIRDGENGLLVHPEDVEGIATAIRRAATDDDLVDGACEINERIAMDRLDRNRIRVRIAEAYESLRVRSWSN